MEAKLTRKLRIVRDYRNRIDSYMDNLDRKLKNGKIDYKKYFFKQSRFLKGKSERAWREYLQNCEIKLRSNEDCKLEGPRAEINYILPVLVLVALIGVIFAANYTGFVVLGEN